MSARRGDKPRLTVICESYWPELTSTGQLITELAESLSLDFEVEVLAAQPRFNSSSSYEKQRSSELRNGVLVRRLAATSFPKESRSGRLVNWLSFLGSVMLAISTRWSGRTYLFLTNPPTAPWALPLARLLRHPAFVLVYDLYPDLAEAIGAVKKNSLMARGFDCINKLALGRASGVIALGQDMHRRLREKLGAQAPISIIPNWANGNVIHPLPKASSQFAIENGLVDKMVFLYAGNLGLFQDLETLVEAVDSLPTGTEKPMLIFVGNGGKRRKVEAMAATSERVRVFDWLRYEQLGDLYAAADVGLIALEPGVEKTNVPSKTYSILAAGKPFLAVCDGSTDLEALASEGCGICVPNDAGEVAKAMNRLMQDRGARDSMSRQARSVFDRRYSREVILQRYRELLIGKTEAAEPPRYSERQQGAA